MPTPSHFRDTTTSNQYERSSTLPSASRPSEWRCRKLLGIHRDGRMHLRFARAHEYLVGFPVVATCRGCGTLSQASAPAR
jgi:hypothetical protein